ncbi:MAG TPA: helix-turn-helix domain-containing protein [Mycobacteriales bacterium]|nr:helix-turn-helix domain-containing protein [Mycobacteriales bacterium]
MTTDSQADPEPTSMRERILDVALDLFIANGYDGTSLREIAEKLGVTKAALYYHFASKEDILMALHMRLHAVGRSALAQLADGKVTVSQWRTLLDAVLEEMLSQRKIFLLHERNQAVFEKLHREDHVAEHEDIQDRFRKILSDPAVPLRDRVRMAASVGAVFGTLFMFRDAFGKEDDDRVGRFMRSSLDDILGLRVAAPTKR